MAEGDQKFDVKSWAEAFQQQLHVFVEGVKEDLRQRDDQIKLITQNQQDIASSVSKLTATVEGLTEGQRGMFSRMNRPWQWGVVLAAFMALASFSAMFGTVLTLSLNPIRDNLTHMEANHLRMEEKELALHMMLKEDIENNQIEIARLQEGNRWMEKLEERYNMRIHGGTNYEVP
jgi:hypothetical protein